MPGGRNAFTKEDDDRLAKYIAKYNPSVHGRNGTKLYKTLVENEDKKWKWSERHPWQSWRERYVKNTDKFDRKIRDYLIESGESLQQGGSTSEKEVTEEKRSKRNVFTKADDDYLAQYIARYNVSTQGRSGQTLYKTLVENKDNKWKFSTRHTWQSWRERYVKNTARFDRKIHKYIKRDLEKAKEELARLNQEEAEEESEERGTANDKSGLSSPSLLNEARPEAAPKKDVAESNNGTRNPSVPLPSSSSKEKSAVSSKASPMKRIPEASTGADEQPTASNGSTGIPKRLIPFLSPQSRKVAVKQAKQFSPRATPSPSKREKMAEVSSWVSATSSPVAGPSRLRSEPSMLALPTADNGEDDESQSNSARQGWAVLQDQSTSAFDDVAPDGEDSLFTAPPAGLGKGKGRTGVLITYDSKTQPVNGPSPETSKGKGKRNTRPKSESPSDNSDSDGSGSVPGNKDWSLFGDDDDPDPMVLEDAVDAEAETVGGRQTGYDGEDEYMSRSESRMSLRHKEGEERMLANLRSAAKVTESSPRLLPGSSPRSPSHTSPPKPNKVFHSQSRPASIVTDRRDPSSPTNSSGSEGPSFPPAVKSLEPVSIPTTSAEKPKTTYIKRPKSAALDDSRDPFMSSSSSTSSPPSPLPNLPSARPKPEIHLDLLSNSQRLRDIQATLLAKTKARNDKGKNKEVDSIQAIVPSRHSRPEATVEKPKFRLIERRKSTKSDDENDPFASSSSSNSSSLRATTKPGATFGRKDIEGNAKDADRSALLNGKGNGLPRLVEGTFRNRLQRKRPRIGSDHIGGETEREAKRRKTVVDGEGNMEVLDESGMDVDGDFEPPQETARGELLVAASRSHTKSDSDRGPGPSKPPADWSKCEAALNTSSAQNAMSSNSRQPSSSSKSGQPGHVPQWIARLPNGKFNPTFLAKLGREAREGSKEDDGDRSAQRTKLVAADVPPVTDGRNTEKLKKNVKTTTMPETSGNTSERAVIRRAVSLNPPSRELTAKPELRSSALPPDFDAKAAYRPVAKPVKDTQGVKTQLEEHLALEFSVSLSFVGRLMAEMNGDIDNVKKVLNVMRGVRLDSGNGTPAKTNSEPSTTSTSLEKRQVPLRLPASNNAQKSRSSGIAAATTKSKDAPMAEGRTILDKFKHARRENRDELLDLERRLDEEKGGEGEGKKWILRVATEEGWFG